MLIKIEVRGAKSRLEELAAFFGWRVAKDGDTYAILDAVGRPVLRTKDADHFEFDAVELMTRKFEEIRNTALDLVANYIAAEIDRAEFPELREPRFKRVGKFKYLKYKLDKLLGVVTE